MLPDWALWIEWGISSLLFLVVAVAATQLWALYSGRPRLKIRSTGYVTERVQRELEEVRVESGPGFELHNGNSYPHEDIEFTLIAVRGEDSVPIPWTLEISEDEHGRVRYDLRLGLGPEAYQAIDRELDMADPDGDSPYRARLTIPGNHKLRFYVPVGILEPSIRAEERYDLMAQLRGGTVDKNWWFHVEPSGDGAQRLKLWHPRYWRCRWSKAGRSPR